MSTQLFLYDEHGEDLIAYGPEEIAKYAVDQLAFENRTMSEIIARAHKPGELMDQLLAWTERMRPHSVGIPELQGIDELQKAIKNFRGFVK